MKTKKCCYCGRKIQPGQRYVFRQSAPLEFGLNPYAHSDCLSESVERKLESLNIP